MLTRRFASSIAALVAAGLLVTTGCGEQAAAVRVGSRDVSQDHLTDLLQEGELVLDEAVSQGLVPEEQAGDLEGQMRTSYNQEYAGRVVQRLISTLLMRQVMEDRGVELDGAEVSSARQQLEQDPVYGKLLDEGDLSEDRLTELAEESRLIPALHREMCPEYVSTQGEPCPEVVAAMREERDHTDIEISSKLGTWDKTSFAVVPPEGPLTGSGGSGVDDMMLQPGSLPG